MKRQRSNFFARFLVVVLLPVMILACAQQPVTVGLIQCRGNACETQHYVIGAGDVLVISVWNEPELDRTVTVRPDGMVSYPLVNDIKAVGLTPMELQEKITAKLQKYISTPVVSVVVEEINSFGVSVLGNVVEPGHYQLDSAVTVLDMLAKAGGLNEFASSSNITVLSNVNSTRVSIPFDYDKAISARGSEDVFYVHSGDVIMVP